MSARLRGLLRPRSERAIRRIEPIVFRLSAANAGERCSLRSVQELQNGYFSIYQPLLDPAVDSRHPCGAGCRIPPSKPGAHLAAVLPGLSVCHALSHDGGYQTSPWPWQCFSSPERKMTSIFERYLTVWVLLCFVAGILLGKIAPGLAGYLDGLMNGT